MQNPIKHQLDIFLTALMFYTRVSVPYSPPYSPAMLNKATRYFPLIGWLVGGVCGAVFYVLVQVFPLEVAVLGSMVIGLLVTGAFHEDGFADVCDGFGGGWTKERILDIMKDSRVGAYGAIGILMLLLLKYQSVVLLNPLQIPFFLWVAHSLSRWGAVNIIYTQQYARADLTAKAKPLAVGITTKDYMVATVFGLLPTLIYVFFSKNYFYASLIFFVWLHQYYWGNYFKKYVGGYTGDCLGAVQQMGEVWIYVLFLIKIF